MFLTELEQDDVIFVLFYYSYTSMYVIKIKKMIFYHNQVMIYFSSLVMVMGLEVTADGTLHSR